MVRRPASQDEWRVYYDRADERRASTGDPFHHHLERERLRQRALLVGAALFVLGLVTTAFYLLTP